MKFNLHTHSNFCDGSADPEDYIKVAIENGFETLGFSSHAPVPFENKFAIESKESLSNYCSTILELKKKYADIIGIALGLELDYIPGKTYNFKEIKRVYNLDYTIGGIHLVKGHKDLWFIDGPFSERYENGIHNIFDGDAKRAVGNYFNQLNEMIISQNPDIVAHFDKIKMHNRKRFFTEDESWYKNHILESISLFKEYDTIVEVNTRGKYRKRSESFFPGEWVIKLLAKNNIRITVSSDAHKPHELSLLLDEAKSLCKKCGLKEIYAYSGDGFVPVEL